MFSLSIYDPYIKEGVVMVNVSSFFSPNHMYVFYIKRYFFLILLGLTLIKK